MKCPDCGREMKAVTSRTPEGAWKCEYCEGEVMTEEDAEKKGLPREMYGPYRKMILGAMKLVKPKKAPKE
jgi:ribosomal protein L37AE/L43A